MQVASLCSEEISLRVRVDDAERLAVLSQYEVIDSVGEPDFEMLVEIIQVRCSVPMAAIAFVDRERMWMKASRGFAVPVIPRLHCFCSVCMHYTPPMIIEDALLDRRFRENALVVGEPGIRFYAGFPIFSRESFGLGSVCVVDTKPRSLNLEQMHLLGKTRDWVQAIIEVRRLAAHSAGSTQAHDAQRYRQAELKMEHAWQTVRSLF